MFRSVIEDENDVIQQVVYESMDILRQESRMWTRKGKLEIYRLAFASLASNVMKLEFQYIINEISYINIPLTYILHCNYIFLTWKL